jgi:glyoxylase I family protein
LFGATEERIMAFEIVDLCPMLQVFDMPTSVRFYRDVLGFELVSNSVLRAPDEFGWCLLRYTDGTEMMLNTAYDYGERPESPEPARVAAHGDTCMYFGCPDVDGACRHLRGKGVVVDEPRIAWYGMKQLYLTDPDGFGICFQWQA